MGFQSFNTRVQPETTSFTVRSLFIFRSVFHIDEFGITRRIYNKHLQIEGNKGLKKKEGQR